MTTNETPRRRARHSRTWSYEPCPKCGKKGFGPRRVIVGAHVGRTCKYCSHCVYG